jgi:hypothetical protein
MQTNVWASPFIPILKEPSWVKTDMGGKGAVIEPHHDISVTAILNIVTKLPTADAGKFYNLGKQNPW